MPTEYRHDINGLRAISIIAIFLFHLNHHILPGGFVGVDIFFVISGFLITQLIIKDIANAEFRFLSFYARRIRRIFPALFVMLLCTTLLAALLLARKDIIAFAKSLAYAALQISNFLFQSEVDYFQASYKNNPLLHTWSLGVEEQFYLIWPAIVLFFFKMNKKGNVAFYAIIIFSCFSLVFSQYLLTQNPRVAFFAMPSRLWELGLGSILAFHKITISSQNIRTILGKLGLVLIGYSLFMTQPHHFPGINALLPCLGAACIILAGNTSNASFLSHRYLGFIGLISYSLYLWHWPIIIFYKELTGNDVISTMPLLAIIAISIAIAYLSYRYIETPCRDQISYHVTPYHSIIIAILFIILFSSISLNIRKTNGWQWRLDATYNSATLEERPKVCAPQLSSDQSLYFSDLNRCISGAKNNKVKALLVGDSHVGNYYPAISHWAAKNDIALFSSSLGGCPPIIGDTLILNTLKHRQRNGESLALTCHKNRAHILQLLKEYPDIDYVFLAARWSLYDSSSKKFLLDHQHTQKSLITTGKLFTQYMNHTLKQLSTIGKTVILLWQVPYFEGEGALACLQKSSLPIRQLLHHTSHHQCVTHEKSSATQYQTHAYQSLKKLTAQYHNVFLFDPIPSFCDDKLCYATKEDQLLYKDTNHLNNNGANFLKEHFIMP